MGVAPVTVARCRPEAGREETLVPLAFAGSGQVAGTATGPCCGVALSD